MLRRALADERAHPKYIETVPRRGYRFVGAVRTGDDAVELRAEPAMNRPDATPTTPPAVTPPRERSRARVSGVLAGAAGLAAVAALAAVFTWPAPWNDIAARSVWLSQSSPPDASIASGGVLSPDGRYLAFIARDDTVGRTGLWVRSLRSSALERIPGTEGASKPFWSPDSCRIGFFASGKLMTVDLAGQAYEPSPPSTS